MAPSVRRATLGSALSEVHQVRYYRLCALPFQKLHQMVICKGHVLDKDLAHNADSGLSQCFLNWQRIKSFYDTLTNLSIGPLTFRIDQTVYCNALPVFMQIIGRTLSALIRSHSVQTAHKQIAVNNGLYRLQQHLGRNLKSAVFLKALNT